MPQKTLEPATKGYKKYIMPDDEHTEQYIDLNAQLIGNRSAAYCFRMHGEAMADAGIHSGDMLLVDRSITHANGKVIVAMLNGEMMVRRLEKTLNKIRLIPETPRLSPIEVDPLAEFSVWGVVTHVIHTL